MRKINDRLFTGAGMISGQRAALLENTFEEALKINAGLDQCHCDIPDHESKLIELVRDLVTGILGKEIMISDIDSKKVVSLLDLSYLEGRKVKIDFKQYKIYKEYVIFQDFIGTVTETNKNLVYVKFDLDALLEIENKIRKSRGLDPKPTPFHEEENWRFTKQTQLIPFNQNYILQDGSFPFLSEFIKEI